ncbi:PREDICTED: putative protein arginine N-methyltransferase 9 [Amphimedon queenslandica]|uniref:Protein arginine N-methyltransferase domain-containing protein n=1 Tax=Amphimedon queenslandica TaxID=400682 RepID=A0A1X7V834_AMPQE|nr:PREDICTED: putative protein arginine N-methyltransferase 9 [Amphimedon queenslandica]|eukprot:XP_019850254.1 PREDICTED: putative protein arginine N-methyltransferase 9 [Amphimedon queenslandica]
MSDTELFSVLEGASTRSDLLDVLGEFTDANDPRLLLSLAKKCQEHSMYRESEALHERALEKAPLAPAIKESLRHLYLSMVDRWHYLMLNDIQRNSNYFKAILSTVRSMESSSTTVLDIGAGSGILSLMAVRAGAVKVFACELSDVMCELCQDVISANDMSDQIEVIHSVSTELTQLPERVSLIITETVDAGLLGELIVPSLRHAWTTFLQPNLTNGHMIVPHVIPCGATVYVCPVECSEIRKQSKLLNPQLLPLTHPIQITGSCKFNDTHSSLVQEPYSCERLSAIRGSFKYLSSPQVALSFNFADPAVPLPPPNNLSFPILHEGRMDCLVSWFTLHLDRNHHISTSPSSSTSWEQAIFPFNETQEEYLLLSKGYTLPVLASCTDTELVLRINQESSKEDDTDTDINAHSVAAPLGSDVVSRYYVERSELLRLNDEGYINRVMSALRSFQEEEEEELEEEEGEGVTVLDITDLPLISLLMVKADNKTGGNSPAAALKDSPISTNSMVGMEYVLLGSTRPYYEELVQQVIESNGIRDKVSLMSISEAHTLANGDLWDIIYCELITPQGTLNTHSIQLLRLIRPDQSQLLCHTVQLHVVGVASPALRAHSCVLGTVPTLGFDIASYINKYQVSHYTDINLETFPHETVTKNSNVSLSLSNYCDIEVDLSIDVIKTESITGFCYWFTLCYHDNQSLCTGPHSYEGSHWHQAAFLLKEDVSVSEGQTLPVHVSVQDGALDIRLVE